MRIQGKDEAAALLWFNDQREEAVAAIRGLEQQMTDLESVMADDLCNRVGAVFAQGQTPLSAVMLAAAKMYATALQLCIESLTAGPGKKMFIN